MRLRRVAVVDADQFDGSEIGPPELLEVSGTRVLAEERRPGGLMLLA
jgi:hypothetical protein